MENQKDTENSETTEDSNRPSMSDVVRFLEGTKDPTLPPNRLLSSPPQASSSIVVPNNRYNPLSNLHVRYQLIWIKVVHKVKSRNLYDVVVTEEVEGENCMTQEREGDIIVEIRYKSIGPWGGSGGSEWDDGVFPGILQIEIVSARREICSIEIEYCGNDGTSVGWSNKHGHNPGQQTDKIVFDYPSEYLMGIEGFMHSRNANIAVRSLSFITNKKIHGPYGVNLIVKGDPFTSGKLGKVVGFHGRSGAWLDAIGVHMEDDPNIVVPNNRNLERESGVVDKMINSHDEKEKERDGDIIVEIRYKSIGPCGGSGGSEWDDGVFPGILQIEIARDRREICSIEIEYCGNDGMSVGWSDKHGHNPGQQTDKIVLDYPSEYLMGITGFTHGHGTLNIVAVRSISFITNKKIHGPYGVNLIAKGDSFTSGKLGKVVGFHGRSGLWLDAIGVHVEDPNI